VYTSANFKQFRVIFAKSATHAKIRLVFSQGALFLRKLYATSTIIMVGTHSYSFVIRTANAIPIRCFLPQQPF
jgi:hypothetical protein